MPLFFFNNPICFSGFVCVVNGLQFTYNLYDCKARQYKVLFLLFKFVIVMNVNRQNNSLKASNLLRFLVLNGVTVM